MLKKMVVLGLLNMHRGGKNNFFVQLLVTECSLFLKKKVGKSNKASVNNGRYTMKLMKLQLQAPHTEGATKHF